MGLCVFDVYEKYYNSKTGGMSNIMGKNPYPLSPQGVKGTNMEQNNWEIYSLAGSKIIQIIIIIKIASLCKFAHCSLQ